MIFALSGVTSDSEERRRSASLHANPASSAPHNEHAAPLSANENSNQLYRTAS